MKALEFLKRPGDLSKLRLAVVSGAEEYLRSRVTERVLEGFGPEVVKDVVDGPATRDVSRFDFAGLLDTLQLDGCIVTDRVRVPAGREYREVVLIEGRSGLESVPIEHTTK